MAKTRHQFVSFSSGLTDDAALMSALRADCAVAYRVGQEQQHLPSDVVCANDYHNKGCTFWAQPDKPPACLLDALALSIFRLHVGDSYTGRGGAEWWAQCVGQHETIGFHFDKDYGAEDDRGVCVYPWYSTVTYLTDVGGPTVVVSKPGGAVSGTDCSSEVHSVVLSQPFCGKHIAFDGRLLHAAPSLFPPSSSSPSPVAGDQKRITFLVNVWTEADRPSQAKIFPKARLADFPSGHLVSRLPSSFRPTPLRVRAVALKNIIQEGLPLDCHRWSFVDGGISYSIAIPLPGARTLATLLDNADGASAHITYKSSGVSVNIDAVGGDEEGREAREQRRKRRRRLWKPTHLCYFG
jgi:hypothetical protein